MVHDRQNQTPHVIIWTQDVDAMTALINLSSSTTKSRRSPQLFLRIVNLSSIACLSFTATLSDQLTREEDTVPTRPHR